MSSRPLFPIIVNGLTINRKRLSPRSLELNQRSTESPTARQLHSQDQSAGQTVPHHASQYQADPEPQSEMIRLLQQKPLLERRMPLKKGKVPAKTNRCSKFPMIDKELREFVSARNKSGHFVSLEELKGRALSLANHYQVEKRFAVSRLYFNKFLDDQLLECPTVLTSGENRRNTQSGQTAEAQQPHSEQGASADEENDNLKQLLLQKLGTFVREFLSKVRGHTDMVMRELVFLSEDEARPLILFQADLIAKLTEYATTTLATLTDFRHLKTLAFIDSSKRLMNKLFSLTEEVLSSFKRLGCHLEHRILLQVGERVAANMSFTLPPPT